MDTILIMTPDSIGLSDFQSLLARHWPVESTGLGALVIQEGNARVYFHEDKDYAKHIRIDGVASPQLREWFEKLGSARFFTIDYSDQELVRRVLEAIADDSEIVVDNDFGTVLRGNDFVAKLRADSKWNWRLTDRERSDGKSI